MFVAIYALVWGVVWLPGVLAHPAAFTVYAPVVMRTTAREERFASSGPIAVSDSGATVWVANPDAGSVTLLDAIGLAKMAEIVVDGEPWSLAISPDGDSVYVVDRAGGALVVIDTISRRVRARLSVGPEPAQVLLNHDGTSAYVTVGATAEVVIVDTASLQERVRIAVAPHPYALAWGSVGGEPRVYVTHLLTQPRPGGSEATDNGREGVVTVIDPQGAAVVDQIALPPDVHGFPGMLASIAVVGQRAWVPTVRAAPDLPMGLTTTVFAAVSALDVNQNREISAERVLLNDIETFGSPVNDPIAAVPAPDGKTLYVVLAGSDLVEVVDLSNAMQPRLVKFLPAGHNPRGMALSPDGRWGYVMSYLSRAVTVLDLQQLAVVATLPVVDETLDSAVLRGKLLFNTATDRRLSQGSWISCASCHADGGSDTVTWMFPDGPRQTPPLWNAAQTLPWHWSAALDEAQDVETTIRTIQHGIGLLPGAEPALLGTSTAGRSADMDALAAYLARGIRSPELPPSSADAIRGRAVFATAGCASCHGGPQWTSSAEGVPGTLDPDGNGMIDNTLRDVGTLNARDVRGATGFDPPSLLGVGLTAPYLHDGSMLSLEALLLSGHPDPAGRGNGLSATDRAALVAFLNSIGPHTPPIVGGR